MRFVAGADIEKHQVVYIEADGKAYPYGQTLVKEPAMQPQIITSIKPTIGRIVHYYHTDLCGPLPAIICYVHPDGSINVAVFCKDGTQLANTKRYPTCAVRLVQPGESPAPSDPYCTWMDYQIGQAAKTEAAQSEIDKLKAEYLKRATAAQHGEVDITDKPS